MKNIKYIIKFYRDTDNGADFYIKQVNTEITSDNIFTIQFKNRSFLTKNPAIIDSDCIFNTKIEAQDFIKMTIKVSKKQLNVLIRENDDDEYDYYYSCENGFKQEIKKETLKCDINRYFITEHIFEFDCDTTKKTIKREWKNDGTASDYCTSCGGNLYYGKYAKMARSKICPFCLRKFGREAQTVIDEIIKDYSDIESKYNIGVFIAHLD